MQVWLDNRISLDSYNIAPIYDNERTFLTAYNGNLVDDLTNKHYNNFRICQEFSFDKIYEYLKVNDIFIK